MPVYPGYCSSFEPLSFPKKKRCHGSPRGSTATTTRESFERGRRLKNCFHRENSSLDILRFMRICACVRGTDSTKRSHYGMISSVLYRLFMPFVIPDFYSTTLYAVPY